MPKRNHVKHQATRGDDTSRCGRLGWARPLVIAALLASFAAPLLAQPPEASPRMATNPLRPGLGATSQPFDQANGNAPSVNNAARPAPLAPPAASAPATPAGSKLNDVSSLGSVLSPGSLPASLQWMVVLSALSVAPAALLMTTAFVRIMVVLTLLRQALGSPQLPPNQVLTALAVFVTLFVMAPTWEQVYRDAALPYSKGEVSLEDAWNRGIQPIRRFMSLQIERTGNQEDVWLFVRRLPNAREPQTYDDVPLAALVPAFMLSELKTAFLIGFQIYLPFIVLDLVAAAVTTSMGMVMLPPGLVSLPLKLLVFVLADGWRLVVGMLLDGFAAG